MNFMRGMVVCAAVLILIGIIAPKATPTDDISEPAPLIEQTPPVVIDESTPDIVQDRKSRQERRDIANADLSGVWGLGQGEGYVYLFPDKSFAPGFPI